MGSHEDTKPATTGIERQFLVLLQFPDGLTNKETVSLLEERDRASASSNNSHLVRYGLAEKFETIVDGKRAIKYRAIRKRYKSKPCPRLYKARQDKDQLTQPIIPQEVLDELQALREFKEVAVKTYPDLLPPTPELELARALLTLGSGNTAYELGECDDEEEVHEAIRLIREYRAKNL